MSEKKQYLQFGLHKRGKNYHYRFTINGNRYRGSCYTSNKQLATEKAKKVYLDIYNETELGITPPKTWNELLLLYIENPRFTQNRKHTIEMYLSYIKTIDKTIDITKTIFNQESINNVLHIIYNKDYKDKTKYVYYRFIKTLYNFLINHKYIKDEIVFSVPTLRPKPKDNFLTYSQYQGLINSVDKIKFANNVRKKDHKMIKHVISLLVHTGCRINELLQLTGDKVFLNSKTPYILITDDISKTHKERKVPILGNALEDIKYLISIKNTERLLPFTSETTNKWLNQATTINNNINDIKIDFKLTNHVLRHTCITWLQTGVFKFLNNKPMNEKLIQSIVGHEEGSKTTKIYTHFTLDNFQDFY